MPEKGLKLYLASQSARRHELLHRMKITFHVVASGYRERMFRHLAPEALVLRHARGKAREARLPAGARFVMGADTVVYHDNRVFGKPRSRREAREMLGRLSGKTHRVFTGIVLEDRHLEIRLEEVDCTHVTFRKLKAAEIEAYLDCINPFDKAGSYAIQEGPRIVSRYDGSYSNVIGLPVERLRKMLRRIKPAAGRRTRR